MIAISILIPIILVYSYKYIKEYYDYIILRTWIRKHIQSIWARIEKEYIQYQIKPPLHPVQITSVISINNILLKQKLKSNQNLIFYYSNVFMKELQIIDLFMDELQSLTDQFLENRYKNAINGKSQENRKIESNYLDHIYKISLVYYKRDLINFKYSWKTTSMLLDNSE